MNQKDPEKEVQVPAMSFLVCTWQGHLPLPPGALVNLELPFVEYLLCAIALLDLEHNSFNNNDNNRNKTINNIFTLIYLEHYFECITFI